MIYLKLFWSFFQVGLFSFGGGMGMMQLIEQQVVTKNLWITSDTLYNFIAIAESTPGPIAVNIATFIGVEKAGILGGLCATFGVVFPSFVVILIVSKVFRAFSQNVCVKTVISYMSQVIYGLLASFALLMIFKNLIVNYGSWGETLKFNYLSLVITAILFIIYFLYKKVFKKKMSPILLIVLSAITGILVYL